MSDSDNTELVRFDPFATREVSAEEEEFRQNEYPDEDAFLKKKSFSCTACGKELRKSIVDGCKLSVHPALEVIVCRDCEEFYNDGEFSVDEDGSDKYCRWCGQGGSLYCCSHCSVAICAKCVKRNLPKKYTKEIERDDWRCFVCDPKPIWSSRALCHAAKQYLDNQKSQPKRTRKATESDIESDEEASVNRSKRSKRTRKAIESDSESDEEHYANRSKRSKKDTSNEDRNGTKEKRRGNSAVAEEKQKVSNTRNRNDDSEQSSTSLKKKKGILEETVSEDSSPATPAKKKDRKTRNNDSDSEESVSASPDKRTTPKSRRATIDSDESPEKTSSRTRRETVDSKTSPSKKKDSKNRRENDDSEDSIPNASTKEKASRGRPRRVDSNRRENSDSEDSTPNTPTEKKASRGRPRRVDSNRRENSDSEEDSIPNTATKKKAKGRPRRVDFNRRENSDSEDSIPNASTEKKASRGRPRRVDSNRRENSDSEDSVVPNTPAKVKGSRGRPRKVDLEESSLISSAKKERSLLELLLIDTMKDFRKFTKVVAKNQNDFEEKYLKSKKYLDSEKLSRAKDELLCLMRDTKESIIGLETSYLKGLKSLEKDDKLVNGDKSSNATSDRETPDEAIKSGRTSDTIDEDETPDANNEDEIPEAKGKSIEANGESDVDMDDSTVINSEMEATRESKKMSDSENEVETSTQKALNATETTSAELNESVDQSLDKSKHESVNENKDGKLNMEVDELSQPSSFSSSNRSNLDNSRSMADDEVYEDAMTLAELANTSHQNGVSDKSRKDLPSEEKNTQAARDMSVSPLVNKDKGSSQEKLSRSGEPKSSDSSGLSDNEENAKAESESDISGIDILKSDMDEVKAV